jgi:predicted nuclease with TOPRIM domain
MSSMHFAGRHLIFTGRTEQHQAGDFTAHVELQPATHWRVGMAELIRVQNRMDVGNIGVSSEQMLEDALKAREQLLREHPHLQAYQDEIDGILQKVIGFNDRMAVLGMMMEAKIYQLRDSVVELRSIALKMESLLKTEKENSGKLLS